MLQINKAENYTSIKFRIEPNSTLYDQYMSDLVANNHWDREDAHKYLIESEFELDLYYEAGFGFVGLDSNAIDNDIPLYSPFTRRKYNEPC
jgi:hypothetical protein